LVGFLIALAIGGYPGRAATSTWTNTSGGVQRFASNADSYCTSIAEA
jgi:hypothetical protein